MTQGRRRAGAVLVAMVCVAGFGVRFACAESASEKVTPEYRAQVRRVMEVTNSDSTVMALTGFMAGPIMGEFRKQHPEAPDSFEAIATEEMRKAFLEGMDGMRDRVAVIYSAHFTLEDLRALADFYQTPLGRKMIHEMPALMQESYVVGMKWAQEMVPVVVRRLEQRLATRPAGRTKS